MYRLPKPITGLVCQHMTTRLPTDEGFIGSVGWRAGSGTAFDKNVVLPKKARPGDLAICVTSYQGSTSSYPPGGWSILMNYPIYDDSQTAVYAWKVLTKEDFAYPAPQGSWTTGEEGFTIVYRGWSKVGITPSGNYNIKSFPTPQSHPGVGKVVSILIDRDVSAFNAYNKSVHVNGIPTKYLGASSGVNFIYPASAYEWDVKATYSGGSELFVCSDAPPSATYGFSIVNLLLGK